MKTALLALSVLFLVPQTFAGFRRVKPEALAQPPIEIKSTDVCFSPDGKCDLKLIAFIGTAGTSLDIAIYSLTHKGIMQALIEAHTKKGVKIRIIADQEQGQVDSSKLDDLKAAGITDIKYGKVKAMMHDKYCIVDGRQLETGSFNYTMNATANDRENQIYISDPDIVKQYMDDFESMWIEGLSTDVPVVAVDPNQPPKPKVEGEPPAAAK